jgi:hypothetical protein
VPCRSVALTAAKMLGLSQSESGCLESRFVKEIVDSKSKSIGSGGSGGGENPEDAKSAGATSDIADEQRSKPANVQLRGERGRSFDPNEKVGPAGVGPLGFVRSDDILPYAIYFENDPTKATLPAQEVIITEQLDADLDLTNFELGDIVVGSEVFSVPPGRSVWATTHTLKVNDIWIDLRIEAELDFLTRTVTWTFASLDMETGLLTSDFDAGFLPVNDETGRGEGHVRYTVYPKDNLPSGTVISGSAKIIFDTNDPQSPTRR